MAKSMRSIRDGQLDKKVDPRDKALDNETLRYGELPLHPIFNGPRVPAQVQEAE